MGRWTQYDEDDYRLPEGMKRVGYDADTQRYTFKDQNGQYWIGPEGSQYGELTKAQAHNSDVDLEAPRYSSDDSSQVDATIGQIHASERRAYQKILPFLLIIIVFLLLVFRLVSPGLNLKLSHRCSVDERAYTVKKGDTCWAISKVHGTSVDKLQSSNSKLECSSLHPGDKLCVPS